MKSRFFMAAIACLLAVTACKEDNETPSYYLKFEADGVGYTFGEPRLSAELNKGNPVYDGWHTQPYYPFSLAAYGADSQIFFGIKSPVQITTTEYKSNDTDDYKGIPSIDMTCTLPVDDTYVRTQTYSGYLDINVTITELTIDYVKGTFSGPLYSGDSTSTISITHGEFRVRRSN